MTPGVWLKNSSKWAGLEQSERQGYLWLTYSGLLAQLERFHSSRIKLENLADLESFVQRRREKRLKMKHRGVSPRAPESLVEVSSGSMQQIHCCDAGDREPVIGELQTEAASAREWSLNICS